MFTGLVEEIGRIGEVDAVDDGRRFRIGALAILEGMSVGDSIAVDGVCLTVTAHDRDWFEVFAMATTLNRTTLGDLRPGQLVNLERAMALGDRLGGHMVQGHVDGVGEVIRVDKSADHVLIDFSLPPLVADVTILHGSITVSGISLTVNELPEPGVCQVSIIPHTWEVTALHEVRPGTRLNLEGDMIGKYVRHLLGTPDREAAADATAHVRERWGYDR